MTRFSKPEIGSAFNAASGATKPPPLCRTTTKPVSLRMSFEEKARLERDAAGMSLAAYIRWRLFEPSAPPPKSRGKFPVKDHRSLSKLLGLLGQTRIANNLNQLARAVNSGSLSMDPQTERELREAASDVADMRRLLLEALRLEDA